MELQPCQGIDNTGYFFKVLLLGLLDCEEDESLGLGGILLVVVLLLKNVSLGSSRHHDYKFLPGNLSETLSTRTFE